MPLKHFRIEEHIVPAQHIREYRNAIKSFEEDTLKLAVKHYVPYASSQNAMESTDRENLQQKPITIIAAHANGFPKEMYEPMWDDLWEAMAARGLEIRGILFPDCAHQGASGVLNEHLLGDDPSYFDHSRDLLLMINHFRNQVVRPVVGFAHSMGCPQIVHLASMHPRLFDSLILIEPVIQDSIATVAQPALPATLRRDLWQSRSDAEASTRKAKVFKTWDPRVLDAYIKHAFRPLPTALYPAGTAPTTSVTLTTTKYQEAWSYTRAHFDPIGTAEHERLMVPDLHPGEEGLYTLFRPECLITLKSLPHLRPPVLWMFGLKSPMAKPEWIDEKMRTTGVGVGGSGGEPAGRVKKKVWPDAGHFLPCEKVFEVCNAAATWLKEQHARLEEDEAYYKRTGTRKSTHDMLVASEQWIEEVKKPRLQQRRRANKL